MSDRRAGERAAAVGNREGAVPAREESVTRLSNGQTEVRVVDTGQGISPDFLPHVFDRFRQADGPTTRRQTGLGLWLAIARQLVELHRGTVQAASEGVGRGATFIVRLPTSASEASGGQETALGDRRIAASTASPMPRTPIHRVQWKHGVPHATRPACNSAQGAAASLAFMATAALWIL